MHTILIVDDQANIRRLLHATLGKQYNIVLAEDGVSALQAMQQSQPDLVLLDVMMPGELDGLQVLEQIKSNPHTRNTPVAMLSARGQSIDKEAAGKIGADAYFVKPFSPMQVVLWVRSKLA